MTTWIRREAGHWRLYAVGFVIGLMIGWYAAWLTVSALTGADNEYTCRTFSNDYVACAPSRSPSGAPLAGRVQEDGSAAYADGTVWDPEDSTFRPLIRWGQR